MGHGFGDLLGWRGAARMANNKANVTDVTAELINIICKL